MTAHVTGGNLAVPAAMSGMTEVDDLFGFTSDVELSDLELLSSALQDAMDARRTGVITGPDVDEVALRRAERRARRADSTRLLGTADRDGAA